MSEKRCITCGARYMTAHATNCPMYLENKDAIISELEARIEALAAGVRFALDNCHEDNHLMVLHWDAHSRLAALLEASDE